MEIRLVSILFIIALFSSISTGGSKSTCVYTFYVRTGSIIGSGTDSKIGITVGDVLGRSVWVNNLTNWGIMGPDHDYFEQGNLDYFSGVSSCVGAPICRLNLTSDGSGKHHSWYCDYIQVTFSGAHRQCEQTTFYVDQWLSTTVSPFHLTATIDVCAKGNGAVKERIGARRRRGGRKFDSR